MKIIWALFINNWKGFFNDPVALVLSFLVPAGLIFVLGNVFGIGNSNNSNRSFSGFKVGVVNQSDEAMVQALVDALAADESFHLITTYTDDEGTEQALTEEVLRMRIRDNEFRHGVIFPADSIGNSFGFKVSYLINPRSQMEGQMVEGFLQRDLAQGFFGNITKHPFLKVNPEIAGPFNDKMAAVIAETFNADVDEVRKSFNDDSMIPDLERMFAGSSSGSEAGSGDETDGGGMNIMQDFMTLNKEQIIGAEIKNPMGIQVVGGYAVMFMLFALSGAATVLFEEKQAGIYLRILSSPATRSHILWSKYLFGTCLGLFQMLVLFFAGHLLFGVEIFHAFTNLVIVSLFISAACNAFGMLLASVSKTQAQASGLATFIVLIMSAVGGAWFPVSMMPDFMQMFSQMTIVYWSMDALMQILIDGKTLFEAWHSLGILLGITVCVTSISLWRFRKGDLF